MNLLKKIRPNIPIIPCSGLVDTTENIEFDEILIKPVKGVMLAKTIRKVLEKKIMEK